MGHSLTRVQVRTLDRRAAEEFGLPTLVLMELAGRGAAATLLSIGIHGPVLVACGKGNNGGDGLVLARHLADWNIDLKVLLFARPDELSPDAAVNWTIVEKAGIAATICDPNDADLLRSELGRAEWIIDGLLGTGLQGPVKPPLDKVIRAINASQANVFALDVPSGLDADSGEPLGVSIHARHTATFVAPKQGYANPASATWTGEVHVVDIGIPARLIADVMNSGKDEK